MTKEERELPTGPHHEIPEFVGKAPVIIPGAPELSEALTNLFSEVREVRHTSRSVLANQSLQAKALDAFRREVRGRGDGHDIEIDALKDRVETIEREAHAMRRDLDRYLHSRGHDG